MKGSTRLAAGCLLALAALAALVTRAAPPVTKHPLLGTWQYVAEGSKFVGRAPYQGAMITFAAEAGGLHVTEEVVTANGAKFVIDYVDPMDGTFVPVKGNPYYDTQSTTATGKRTYTRKERRAGQDTGTTVMIVARDGKSFTADANRMVPEGRMYHAFVVWRRTTQ
jgi:hypothetical protein